MLDAFSPQAFGHIERINLVLLPPPPLIACRMIFAMMDGAAASVRLNAFRRAAPHWSPSSDFRAFENVVDPSLPAWAGGFELGNYVGV